MNIHNKIHLRMFAKGPSVKITLAETSTMVISKSDTYIGKKKTDTDNETTLGDI